jgi:glycosyltransferase involved in cell wall biosynthesis
MLQSFVTVYGTLATLASVGLARILRKESKPEEDLPTLAVIVAARNEQSVLPDLIGALSAQRYPEEKVSFWIVDDESSDATLKITKAAEKQDGRFHALRSNPLTPISSPKKRALDTAIRQCDAEWIVTTDADCIPGPGWLNALASDMEDGVGVVVGYAPLIGASDPAQAIAAGESWTSAALSAAAIGLGYPFNAFGRNFAYRRQLYLDLGGFGEDGSMASGDDDLLLQRISALTNWKASFAADPRSFVPSRNRKASELIGTKARHLSVGTRYAPGWIALGAVGSALFMGIGAASIAAVFGLVSRKRVLSAWFFKWLFDLIIIMSGYRVLGDHKRALMAVGTASSAPFLLWLIWPRALFGNVQWKGRTFVRGRAGGPLEDEPESEPVTRTLNRHDGDHAG